jgi:hypothetical protein
MINDAHTWNRLPGHGDQVLRRLYEKLNEYRDAVTAKVDLALILSGQAGPLRTLLHANPPLAARFRARHRLPWLHARATRRDRRRPGR